MGLKAERKDILTLWSSLKGNNGGDKSYRFALISGHFLSTVLTVLNVHNCSSHTSKYIESIESQNLKHPFITHVFCDFLLHSFLLFYSLFQNKLDFSPGSSVQGNPLESGPGIRHLFCWLRGKNIHGGEQWETKSSTAVLSRVISIPSKPFLLISSLHGWKCVPRPHWGMACWGLALFKQKFHQECGHHSDLQTSS